MPGRKCDDQITMNDRQSASCHDQAAIRSARERTDAAFDLACVADADWAQGHPAIVAANRLDRAGLAASGRDGGIPEGPPLASRSARSA